MEQQKVKYEQDFFNEVYIQPQLQKEPSYYFQNFGIQPLSDQQIQQLQFTIKIPKMKMNEKQQQQQSNKRPRPNYTQNSSNQQQQQNNQEVQYVYQNLGPIDSQQFQEEYFIQENEQIQVKKKQKKVPKARSERKYESVKNQKNLLNYVYENYVKSKKQINWQIVTDMIGRSRPESTKKNYFNILSRLTQKVKSLYQKVNQQLHKIQSIERNCLSEGNFVNGRTFQYNLQKVQQRKSQLIRVKQEWSSFRDQTILQFVSKYGNFNVKQWMQRPRKIQQICEDQQDEQDVFKIKDQNSQAIRIIKRNQQILNKIKKGISLPRIRKIRRCTKDVGYSKSKVTNDSMYPELYILRNVYEPKKQQSDHSTEQKTIITPSQFKNYSLKDKVEIGFIDFFNKQTLITEIERQIKRQNLMIKADEIQLNKIYKKIDFLKSGYNSEMQYVKFVTNRTTI